MYFDDEKIYPTSILEAVSKSEGSLTGGLLMSLRVFKFATRTNPSRPRYAIMMRSSGHLRHSISSPLTTARSFTA